MSSYVAPLKEIRFVLNELAGLGEVAKLPGYQEATPDTVDAIMEEAAKFATEVLDPDSKRVTSVTKRDWAEVKI